MGMSSSPTDWYDTIDPNEYIGEPSLTKNTDEPKTGSENMDITNITDEEPDLPPNYPQLSSGSSRP